MLRKALLMCACVREQQTRRQLLIPSPEERRNDQPILLSICEAEMEEVMVMSVNTNKTEGNCMSPPLWEQLVKTPGNNQKRRNTSTARRSTQSSNSNARKWPS